MYEPRTNPPEWEMITSKYVKDADGFYTQYTMYRNLETGLYVFVFGDDDLYVPEDGWFDFETESKEEAWEWFNDYNGFEDDDDYDVYGATNTAGIPAKPYVEKPVVSLEDIPEVTTVEIGSAERVQGSTDPGDAYMDAMDSMNTGYLTELISELNYYLPEQVPGMESSNATVRGDSLVIDYIYNGENRQYKIDLCDLFYDIDRIGEDFYGIANDIKEEVSSVMGGAKARRRFVVRASQDVDRPLMMRDIIRKLREWGLDTTRHRYELKAEEYRRYGWESAPIYTFKFTAPGDYLAYFSMCLHQNFSPSALVDLIETSESLEEYPHTLEGIDELASSTWYGDGDDYIIYLKNLDTGEVLYDGNYEAYMDEYEADDEDWEDEE